MISSGQIYIGLEGLGQKDCDPVSSIDSQLLEMLLRSSFSDSATRLLKAFSADLSALSIPQYTRDFRLCSSASVRLQLSAR